MGTMDYKDCAKRLLTHEDILIVTHKNPDGDTASCAAALCSGLRRAGRRAYMFPNPQLSRKLRPYCEKYFAPEGFKAKYIVSVDVADAKLFCQGFEGKVDLCIDHHPSNTHFAKESFVQGERASCAEIVMELILMMNADLTPEEATILYIGLSTDTGCFQYANTDTAAFSAAAELLRAGADNTTVNTVFFRKVSAARIRLESMIYDSIRFYRDGTIAVAVVTLKMLREVGAVEDDLDDLAGLAGRCETSRVNITVREKEDGTCRVSVRSSQEVNSSDICAVFGGGGHAMAAGCTVPGSPEHVRDLLVGVTEEFWK